MNELSFECYLTERRAIPQSGLDAALVLCMEDTKRSMAILFGLSLYGSATRAIFDPIPETTWRIEKAYHALSRSLGYEPDELENNGPAMLLPKFLENGRIDRAYTLPFEDKIFQSFILMAVYHATERLSNDSFVPDMMGDKYIKIGNEIIYEFNKHLKSKFPF